MLTPTGITAEAYIEALMADKTTHIKLTAIDQTLNNEPLVFTDEDVSMTGGLVLSSYMNSDADLTMGRAVMDQVTVALFRNAKTRKVVWSGDFKLELGVDVDEEVGGVTVRTTYYVTVGYYIGKNPERYVEDEVVQFRMVDRMSLFDKPVSDYLDTLTIDAEHSISVAELYEGICDYCGVDVDTGDEMSDMMNREYTALPFTDNGMTCRELIALIAEANCCYARINAAGKMVLRWYEDHLDDYYLIRDNEFDIKVSELDFVADPTLKKKWGDLKDANVKWGDLRFYLWGELKGAKQPFKINALNVRQMEEDSGYMVPANADRNIYLIVDNPFLKTANSTEEATYLDPIYDRLGNFGVYIPMHVECVGNWLIEPGDVISVEVNGGNQARLPIFTRTLKWNGGCRDVYEATGNVERVAVNPYNNRRMSEGGRMHVMRENLEELYSMIQNELGNYSTIQQTAAAIALAVAEKADIVYSSYDPRNAEAYDSTATYAVGEFCTYNSKLWMCTTAIATAEAWNADHWKNIVENTVWVDTSIDSGTNLAKNLWYRYTGGSWVSIDETNVYEKISGITIDSNGVTITGNKNIKLNSGLVEVKAGGNTYQMNQYGFAFTNGNSAPGSLSIESNPRVSDGNLWTVLRSITYPICIYAYNNEAQIGGSKTKLTLTGGGYFLCEYNRYNQPRFVFSSDAKACCGDDDKVWHQVWSEQFYGDSYDQRSSREIKKNIKSIEDCGDRLDQLTPVTFVYKNDQEEKLHSGLIYEDTVDVFPEICHDGKLKTIDYTDLIPYLLKEIQSLRRRVADLEGRLDEMK